MASTDSSEIKFPLVKIKKLVRIKKMYSYAEDRIDKLKGEINTYVDKLYELFPYQSLLTSCRSLLRIRCTDTVTSRIDENKVLQYETSYGTFKYTTDEAMTSYCIAVTQASIEEMIKLNIITEEDLEHIEMTYDKKLSTKVNTTALTKSPELAEIRKHIDDEIYKIICEESKNHDWDANVIYMNRLLFTINYCKKQQQEYIATYNNAKSSFNKLHAESGMEDYVYRDISFRKIPNHAAKISQKDYFIMYDKDNNTNLLSTFELYAKTYSKFRDDDMFVATGKRRVYLRYFINDIEYTEVQDSDEINL